MAEINLLPIELSPNSSSAKLAVKFKKIIIILTVVFVLVSLAGGALIFYFSNQLKTSTAEENSIKQKIQSLEATEEELFLLKDRIGKINQANSEKNVVNSFDSLNEFLASIPNTVLVSNMEINETQSLFTVTTTDSLGMEKFLNSLVTSGIYKNMTLKNFFFEPTTGFTITLDVQI